MTTELILSLGLTACGMMIFLGLMSLGLSLYNGMNKIAEAMQLERHWILNLSERHKHTDSAGHEEKS